MHAVVWGHDQVYALIWNILPQTAKAMVIDDEGKLTRRVPFHIYDGPLI